MITSSGVNVPGGSTGEGDLAPGKVATNLFMQFQGVVPGPDRYTVVLTLNGQDVHRETFELAQGDAQAMRKQLQS